MLHLHTDALLIGRHDAVAERDLAHRVALREAKLATEYREGARAERAEPARRLVLANARTASTTGQDLACCPA